MAAFRKHWLGKTARTVICTWVHTPFGKYQRFQALNDSENPHRDWSPLNKHYPIYQKIVMVNF